MKERKVSTLHPFLDGRVLVDLIVELGLDHLDRLRVLLQVADLHRLMAVHQNQLPKLSRDLRPALLLHRAHQVVRTRLGTTCSDPDQVVH